MMKLTPRRYGVKAPPYDLSGVILNLRMTETSGDMLDYSGNGYHGRVDGAPSRGIAMGNGSSGVELTANGQGVSLDTTTLSPVVNAIRTGSYSQSIVLRNMGWSGAHSPLPFVIWNNSSSGFEVTLFADYVPSSAASWVHRAGWDSPSGVDRGNLTFSYSPSSFDSQTFHLTYVWDSVAGQKRLYRNGVLVASEAQSPLTIHTANTSERIQIGGHLSFSGSYQYRGKISDLIIWDRALTDDDVAGLFSQNGRV